MHFQSTTPSDMKEAAERNGYLNSNHSSETQKASAIPSLSKLNLKAEFEKISTAHYHTNTRVPQIKMVTTSQEVRYLKPNIVLALLDNSQNLISDGPEVLNDLRGVEDCRINTHTCRPLMEFAIFQLFQYLSEELIPASELVRLSVHNETLNPAVVSESIQGLPLKEIMESQHPENAINWRKWTWLLLGTLLTRPGNGVLSNYCVSNDKIIHSMSNECSFIEPISRKGSVVKINFCSALFCFFQDKVLDESALNEFCSLDAKDIINKWTDDLRKKEDEYINLFSAKERSDLFNKHFHPFLLLQEGTLILLYLQFIFLQLQISDALSRNKSLTPIDLLSFLITMGEEKNRVDLTIGMEISKAYANSLSSPDSHLKAITGRNKEKPLTFEGMVKLSFGSQLNFHDIDSKKSPSLAKNIEEWLILQNCFGENDKGEKYLKVNFEYLNNPKREILLFKALIFLLKVQNHRIYELSIQGSASLNTFWLDQFLGAQIKSLILTSCPLIKNSDMLLIQQKCPNLILLTLENCLGLSAIDDGGLLASKPLLFSNLGEIFVYNCPNLKNILLRAPLLIHYDIQENPNLRIIQIFALAMKETSKNIGNIKFSIHFDWDEFSIIKADMNNPCYNDILKRSLKLCYELKIQQILFEANPQSFQDLVLNFVREDGLILAYLGKHMQDNEEVVSAAINQNLQALRFASDRLSNNTRIALQVVKADGLALEFVGNLMKDHVEVVAAAIEQNPHALKFASKNLRNFSQIVLQAVKADGLTLQYAKKEIKRNFEIILSAVRQNGLALQYIPFEYRRWPNFYEEAVKQNAQAKLYIPKPGDLPKPPKKQCDSSVNSL